MTGLDLIAAERNEQISKHDRTIVKDVAENNHYQLSNGAALLTYVDEEEVGGIGINDDLPPKYDFGIVKPEGWDDELWNKMMNKPYKERLIIAGALIAAELDRLIAIKFLTDTKKISDGQ